MWDVKIVINLCFSINNINFNYVEVMMHNSFTSLPFIIHLSNNSKDHNCITIIDNFTFFMINARVYSSYMLD